MAKKNKKKAKSIKIIVPAKRAFLRGEEIEENRPVFCFRNLQGDSVKNCKKANFFIEFLKRLRQLSELTWNEIQTSDRHGYGTEKIPISKLNPQRPNFLTPDVDSLLAFRATGDKHVFLGFRQKNVFHIVYIESEFGDIYDHG
jgi:hypothetical protein